MSKPVVLTCITILLSLFISRANATMRCGQALIDEGNSMQTVKAKCGTPIRQSSEGPARMPNGTPKLNAAIISIWIYGPNGGAYQYLRFIDDKLVAIDLKRE